jgi:PKD repeat protein
MKYKTLKKSHIGVFTLCFIFLGLTSCFDTGYEEFVAPTGNVNNIEPNTLFTTSTDGSDNLSLIFRSYSTDAASYLWDFGDGNTSTEANPDYTYATGGLYTVKLTTTSSDGLIATDSSDVSPVYVDFDFSIIDSEVTFENLSSGVSELEWDFGDETSTTWDSEDDTVEDSNYNPIHIYPTEETYQTTLTVTNFLGEEVSISKNIEGLVLSTVPGFSFTTSSLTATFTDESILAVSYSWDFGDGDTSTDQNPTHTYTADGTYDVTLTTTNEAGVSKSITQAVPVGGIEATFAAVVLNGTGDEYTTETGDNADAWDMTPNSTVVDNSGATIDSPYRAIWRNTDLNDYIDATYCTDEQPGSTSDGNFVDGVQTRGLKFDDPCRRLYQVVAVEPGVEYTFTIQTRSEAEGINTEVWILNTEITTEVGIDDFADAYVDITNDFNPDKSSSSVDNFTTTTFQFTASSDIAVIYVRALGAVDSSTDVFIDNIDIITPGF